MDGPRGRVPLPHAWIRAASVLMLMRAAATRATAAR